MLTLLAFAMVATFMFLIMTKRLSALIALILVPIAFALIGGFAAGLGPMMLDGIRTLAPTGVMLMFAILYFAIMIDSGLFDPAVRKILRLVKGDPLKVSLGTAALAMIVSLDGDGSTTYMICVAAVLPLYSRLGMSPLVMACLIMLSSGVLNMTPPGWPHRPRGECPARRPGGYLRADDPGDDRRAAGDLRHRLDLRQARARPPRRAAPAHRP